VVGAGESRPSARRAGSGEAWEDDAARSGRIACRSKRDLNRFLAAMQRELGAYLWIQELEFPGFCGQLAS
jgi:hypothetical protein